MGMKFQAIIQELLNSKMEKNGEVKTAIITEKMDQQLFG